MTTREEQPGGELPEKGRLEIIAEVEKRFQDPPRSFWGCIEAEVERRLQQKTKEYQRLVIITAVCVGVCLTAVGYIGAREIYQAAVSEATSRLVSEVFQQSTNAIARTQARVNADAASISALRSKVDSSATALQVAYNAGTEQISDYVAQVRNEGQGFLNQLAILKSKGTVIRLEDLVQLIKVQYVTNVQETVRRGFVDLNDEPLEGSVQLRIEPPLPSRGETFVLTSHKTEGKRLSWNPTILLQTFRAHSNATMRIEYVMKPSFANLPVPPSTQ